uniref:Uncharacterized protein n=1 Tax=Anguilla anguilla TaxID=7936 RepID=A0A0E9PKG8_ANGAN
MQNHDWKRAIFHLIIYNDHVAIFIYLVCFGKACCTLLDLAFDRAPLVTESYCN